MKKIRIERHISVLRKVMGSKCTMTCCSNSVTDRIFKHMEYGCYFSIFDRFQTVTESEGFRTAAHRICIDLLTQRREDEALK